MSIAEKFGKFEIKETDRISKEDQKWLEHREEIYKRTLAACKTVYGIYKSEHDQYSEGELEEFRYSGMLVDDFKVLKNLDTLQNDYVSGIFSHFSNKYHVNLENKNKNSDLERRYYRSSSDKGAIRPLEVEEIDYHAILDQIFAQLGGMSFEEKAIKEIKDVLKDKCYMQYRDEWLIKVKGKKFTYTGGYCNQSYGDYGIDYTMIETLNDIENIKEGQFVIITLNMLCKWHKFLKRYVKSICQKALLIFDESDNMSNQGSKRTKAVLNSFRKLKYKTLMTGTSTRNNIAEIYPQLELLYNNSINMLSECEYVKTRNKDGELEETNNIYYMQPYPAYHEGYRLFTASHIPEKITVFGVSQFTQDILNADVLKKIIDKTIITRTFEQITGKQLYEIKQIACEMGEEEQKLYKVALEEFYKMEYLFSKTGNSRKDAMLKILNQLLALLKICAAPQTLREYNKSIMPEKFKKVLSLLNDFSGERVAIGVRHVSVVEAYADEIRNAFPDRPLFIITGNETSLKQRKQIIKALKATKNGVLISTQQSLSASMNIDFVNKCIIPELHWNNSSMSQYYFRFIRYTSTDFKQVYFVTYENSIESNLLKMILVKDKLNLFMKDQDLSDEELYNRFGVDGRMLQNLMYKEKTDDGYVIRWGDQQMS